MHAESGHILCPQATPSVRFQPPYVHTAASACHPAVSSHPHPSPQEVRPLLQEHGTAQTGFCLLSDPQIFPPGYSSKYRSAARYRDLLTGSRCPSKRLTPSGAHLFQAMPGAHGCQRLFFSQDTEEDRTLPSLQPQSPLLCFLIKYRSVCSPMSSASNTSSH